MYYYDSYSVTNVINASKGWYRAVVRGARTKEQKLARIRALPEHEKRMAFMVLHLLEAEKNGLVGHDEEEQARANS